MAHTKRASKRKRGRVALKILGAAGASLALGGSAPATMPIANVPSLDNVLPPEIALDEEEISDVSLATFHLAGQENPGAPRSLLHLTRGGCGCGHGCGGCGGCGGHGFGGCGHGCAGFGRGFGVFGRGCRCGRGCGCGFGGCIGIGLGWWGGGGCWCGW